MRHAARCVRGRLGRVYRATEKRAYAQSYKDEHAAAYSEENRQHSYLRKSQKSQSLTQCDYVSTGYPH